MKVIDLLNKIANGEKVPKKIKYKQFLLDYDFECADYVSEGFLTESSCYLFRSFEQKGSIGYYLNEEVDIIEEDKKPEYVPTYVLCDSDFEEKGKYSKKATEIIDKALEKYSKAINELIEEIEKLKGKSE